METPLFSFRPDHGFALITAVVLIALLAVLLAVMARLVGSGAEIAAEMQGGVQAFYLAEAGGEAKVRQFVVTNGCADVPDPDMTLEGQPLPAAIQPGTSMIDTVPVRRIYLRVQCTPEVATEYR